MNSTAISADQMKAPSQIVDKAAEYGVYVGTHTLSNLISYGTKYTTPKATDALSYAGFAALTRDASASDTTLYVADGHPFSDEVVGASGGRRKSASARN